ncbi:3-hydroxy-2-methylbutyryl-CoA dehydrogenase [Vreelandella aquamarina]|jgi:NAD(P)-dependent dehydrogenase (short-subunit alcohol dehydrogenase family)|uniref:3-hydroxy-2-methylbutyryl-CoA dehydrogenase n=1 Tax=Vreelandella aquamarina TaxID=77097 RepID=A0A6F8XEG9_9GAMM|nr:SDR family NAD(P)-dependent oxidoreductase [Halomonas meridiana]BCB72582.1 3-hydroxy-2-methylbutyryl-CoA dehydrogenase [Halomonas meridiana]
MQIDNLSAVVTGGASGLGLATAQHLINNGALVTIADLNEEKGQSAVDQLGPRARFVKADVTDTAQMQAVFEQAEDLGPLRILVHCAGRGAPVRVVEKDGEPGSLDTFESIVRLNAVGSFNALRLAAARMAKHDPLESGERGVCILTASIAAYDGQIGQIPYATGKAGIVGMTLVAARDLASRKIRVCTIAPGLFDTPLLANLPEHIRAALATSVPNPARLGNSDEYAMLAGQIIENPMLNGETIRLDGALRMAPR